MKEDSILKKVIKIGLPVSLENMIYGLINFIDVFMVGNENFVYLGLGTVAVAGLGFANQMFLIFTVALFGLYSGGGILAAQYFGSKDYKNLKKCLGVSLVVGVSFSILFNLVMLFMPKEIIGLYTVDEKVIEIGAKYLKIVSFTYPLVGVGFAFNMMLRSIGETKYSMYSSILGLIINSFGNYMLIFGKFGFPVMGVEGAALATLIARIISTLFILFLIYKNNLVIAGKLSEFFNLTWKFIVKTLKISLPVFGHEMMWVLGISVYVVIYGRMGTDSAASVQIVKSISSLVFTLFFGFSSATSAIIGKEIGANNEEKAYSDANYLLKVGVIFGILIGITIYLISPIILKSMQVSEAIYPLTRQIVMVEGIIIALKSFTLQLIVGILRAGGDTLWTMYIDIITLWCFAIPIVYFTGIYLKWSIVIVYFFSVSDEILKIYPCVKRFKSKKWINNLVNIGNE